MKNVVAITITVAIIALFVFSNFILVTTAHVVKVDNNLTFVEVDGELFTLEDRPDLEPNTTALIAFYTPDKDPCLWTILDIWPNESEEERGER